jgi:hypothetical protein
MEGGVRMTKRQLLTVAIFSLVCLLLLSGCIDEQALDRRWTERAHASIPVSEIAGYFEWTLILVVPCVAFAGIAVLRGDYVSATHWFVIMVVGVGSFLRITDVIQAIGELFWPPDYSVTQVMDWMGWGLPFPEDIVWTSPFAYVFTDIVPSLYNVWQWVLIAIHGVMLVTITFSRNIKPIAVDLSFIFSWAITPSFLAVFTRAIAETKTAVPNIVTKAALEVFYVFGGFGIFFVMFLVVPGIVGILALTLNWGKFNPSWGKEKDEDESGLLKKLAERFDRDELFAFLGGMAVDAPPPNREGDNGESNDVSTYPRLPPGGEKGRGPEDFGPTPSSPPASPSGSSGAPNAKDFGQRESGQTDIVDTRETEEGVFAPINPSVDPKEISDEIVGRDETGEEDEKFPLEKTKKPLGPVKRDIGKVAKTTAPYAAAVKPELGMLLGAAGELLDSEDNEDQGDKFSPASKGANMSQGRTPATRRAETEQEEEEYFKTLPKARKPSKTRPSSLGEDTTFPDRKES